MCQFPFFHSSAVVKSGPRTVVDAKTRRLYVKCRALSLFHNCSPSLTDCNRDTELDLMFQNNPIMLLDEINHRIPLGFCQDALLKGGIVKSSLILVAIS